eukprot:Opistho-1_new@52130
MNRSFEIGRHAHGQGVHGLLQHTGLVDVIKKGSGPLVERASRYKIRSRFGNRHESAQLQPRQQRKGSRQCQSLRRCHTGLGGAAVNVDLQADLQRRQMRRPLLAQALRDLQAVHRLHPVEVFSHQPRLVALQGADVMPFRSAGMAGIRRTKAIGFPFKRFANRKNLLHALLDIVLAEGALPARHRRHHGLRPESLGHGQQPHAGRITPAREAGRGNPVTHGLELVNNHGHNLNVKLFRDPRDGHYPTAGFQRQEQGLRPASVGRPAAHDPGAWRCPAHQRRSAGPQAGSLHGVRHHERHPAQEL